MPIVRKSNKELLLGMSICVFIVVFTAVDITHDIQDNLPTRHYLHELFLATLALAWLVHQILFILKQRNSILDISNKLNIVTSERNHYLEKIHLIKNDFQQIIQNQFNLWGLSDSEREVALYLIKGASMKEIAEWRNTSETTIRQQALSVYKKAHLAGRQELAGYFLDDLFQVNTPDIADAEKITSSI
ncbi:MAG: hypothetical protein JNM93_04800 [Bacteriovoracaceae bacterium]|nr:hypothetical protein [Bacteriovoracaceae bacterium]